MILFSRSEFAELAAWRRTGIVVHQDIRFWTASAPVGLSFGLLTSRPDRGHPWRRSRRANPARLPGGGLGSASRVSSFMTSQPASASARAQPEAQNRGLDAPTMALPAPAVPRSHDSLPFAMPDVTAGGTSHSRRYPARDRVFRKPCRQRARAVMPLLVHRDREDYRHDHELTADNAPPQPMSMLLRCG